MFKICLSSVVGQSTAYIYLTQQEYTMQLCQQQLKLPLLKLPTNFALYYWRYIAGTCVSTILACSDFTSSSWLRSDVFPTKLSLTIIAWTLQFYQDVSQWINTTTWMNLDDWQSIPTMHRRAFFCNTTSNATRMLNWHIWCCMTPHSLNS